MATVHVFASTGRFRSFEEVRRFIDETYTEVGDGIPSPFVREGSGSEPAREPATGPISTRQPVNGFVNIPGWNGRSSTTARISYSEDLQRSIMELPPGIQARYIHLTQRILDFGPNLGMPHSRAMGQGLFELRLKSKEGIGRVFYCNLPGQRVMMLHAFVKKSAKTPAKALKIARDRMNEVQADADA